jgi:hypothetical protein
VTEARLVSDPVKRVLERGGGQEIYGQLQHNMWVVAARTAVLSVITGGGKWVAITTHADPLRSKSGAISFDLLEVQGSHAAI